MAQHHYVECGLPNVIIEGLDPRTDDPGEATIAIPNITALHRIIALGVVRKEGGLTGAELRFLRTEMGKTQAELGALVHKEALTVGRWERGETPLDQNADALIRFLAIELLGLEEETAGVEEVARRAVPSASDKPIRVDGRDPKNYHLAAA